MINPMALLCLLVRMVRASQGVHVSPFGYIRELVSELQRPEHRRNRSRRVRRYAERIPSIAHDGGAEEGTPVTDSPAGRPLSPMVPAPRDTDAAVPIGRMKHVPTDSGPGTVARVEVNVTVPAAIVRGRCFVSGRVTEARPVENRKLALAVLWALADQEGGCPDRSARQVHPARSGHPVGAGLHAPGRTALVVGEAA